MSIISNIWAVLWGTLTTLPFLGFAAMYLVVYLWKKNHRLALGWAINFTNFLLIHAVIVAYGVIWPDAWSAWWWVILLFMTLLGLLGWLQIKVRGKISLRKISFSTWRISFLLFSLAYIFLFSTGIWKTMQIG